MNFWNKKKKRAIFPGTFEVLHDGHISIIMKALQVFDEVYVVVANNPTKKSRPLNERYDDVQKRICELKIKGLKVIATDSFTVNLAEELEISHFVRGVRDGSDLAYEITLLREYKKMSKKIEIVFFVSDEKYINFSSSKILNKEKK